MTDRLASYVAGTMSDEDALQLEERLFEDEELAAEASRLLAMRDGLRALAAEGPLVPVLHPDELGRLAESYRISVHVPVDGAIATRIDREELVVARIPVELADARRVDVRFCAPDGTAYFVARDVPRAAGEVMIVCKSHVAIAAGRLRIQIADQDDRVRADVLVENQPPS